MPGALVRAKNENAVLDDGAAQGTPKLVLLHHRTRLPVLVQEKGVGVELVVAEEFKQ